MVSRLQSFLRNYKLFSLSLASLLVSIGLEVNGLHTFAHWVLGVVALVAVLPLLWSMWQDVRSGSYGIDILAATAIIASVILGQYWAAMVVVLMLSGGESLEDYAQHRASSELDTLLKLAPKAARVIRKGKTIDIKVDEVRVGDKLVITAGDIVPCDAVVIEGLASFDESSLTGESLPQPKRSGDLCLSGSINLDGAITAKVVSVAKDSQYQQIIKLVKGAASSQAPFVRLADRYSLPFTVMAFALAGAVWAVSGHAIRFLEIIIVATPCPLLLAAPIALVSGMARASRYGIIVKTGSALEKFAEAETVAFDKTGTLTRGELSVSEVSAYGKFKSDEVLSLAASLESGSKHVVAQAIINDASLKKLKSTKVKHIEEISGLGLKAVLKGKEILVGRLSLLEEHKVSMPASVKRSKANQTAVYVSVGGQLAGRISFSDELRAESKSTLDRLHKLGVRECLMVTGDNQSTADLVAKQLGIKQVYAEALPADKLRIISQAKHRPVVFVGDGVNDAPVLTAADVGIALGARGSTAASESADMVILLDDVSRVALGLEIAQRTFKIATQSILAGIGLSLILMVIFATGKFPPLAGAVAQEVVDVVVIFNALRAHLINPSVVDK